MSVLTRSETASGISTPGWKERDLLDSLQRIIPVATASIGKQLPAFDICRCWKLFFHLKGNLPERQHDQAADISFMSDSVKTRTEKATAPAAIITKERSTTKCAPLRNIYFALINREARSCHARTARGNADASRSGPPARRSWKPHGNR